MSIRSVNPATGEVLAEFTHHDAAKIEATLTEVEEASRAWAKRGPAERSAALRGVAERLRASAEELAHLITLEMGKLRREAEAEVEKCAWVCDYYAENAPAFLADDPVSSDASRSLVAYQPLGTVLAIMPWNFPLWQVMRCAAPALAAGNTLLLKHASNVPQCALAIQEVFAEAGLPPGCMRTLLVGPAEAERLIADPRVHAVSLTGSEAAGRRVAAAAGANLKKTVLELGGSDPFVVLADANLDAVTENALSSRFLNCGQSCIAAKRFIVQEAVADEFVARLSSAIEGLEPGDPWDPGTSLAPMARHDLRRELDAQLRASIDRGARLVKGGTALDGPGYFYAATLLDGVEPGMPAFDEETFGPLAAVIRASDGDDALDLANRSRFGLGASVWTADRERGEDFARRLACGAAFVNGMVKSDPRLPFGGIKASGFGRELSLLGIREFVNAKTLWMA